MAPPPPPTSPGVGPPSTLPSQVSQPRNPDPPSAGPTRSSIILAQDEQTARRVSRKLQKKRREAEHTPTMELPERFKNDADHQDSEEEVLQPQGYTGGTFLNINQSIFGLIAAAGSQVDFADRFENQSSDDEDDSDAAMAMTIAGHKRLARQENIGFAGGPLAQTTVLRKPSALGAKGDGRHHRRRISESRLVRSVSGGLSRLSIKSKGLKPSKGKQAAGDEHIPEEDHETSPASDIAPGIEVSRPEGKLAPVMSRMLEARAQMASRPSFDLDRLSGEHGRTAAEAGNTGPSELAKKLMDIFEFDRPEEVIEEYPCWLLQYVLLQGYMYITSRHIAFYAYLPKKANEIAKSGYLSKSGKRNPKYNRYWFRLKGDVLSYYRNPQNLYFPHGQIDLRYGISATVTDKDKDAVHFTITTHHRIYNFKADSVQSAKEWISLPIENVIDIEETQMLDFADTCKIRVIDNDKTYAIDEYFFSFFSFGKEALNVLKILVEDNLSHTQGQGDRGLVQEPEERVSNDVSSKRTSLSDNRERAPRPPNIRTTSKLTEGVKATLSPLSPRNLSPSPRASGEFGRSSFDALRPFGRRSLDVSQIMAGHPDSPRRSFSASRRSQSRNRLGDNGSRHPEKQGSSDSYVQSLEDPSQASLSALVVSGSSEEATASQILRGSDVFHSPTIRRSASASRAPEDGHLPSRPIVRQHTSGLAKFSQRTATTGHVTDPGAGELDGSLNTPTLQNIAKMGGYPFQKANAIIGYLGRQSRRMSTLLATESMGYVEKVSGMWKGGKKHYDEPTGLKTDEEEIEDDPEERANSEARFQAHFALPETEKLQAAYFGHFLRILPLYGKIYISDRHFCFRSLLPGTRTKLILPLKDIENVDKEKGYRFGYAGLVVVIRGHEELFFEFGKAEIRDDCTITILQSIEATRYLRDSSMLDRGELEEAQAAVAERDALQEARNEEFPDHEVQLPRQTTGLSEAPTIIFDDPKASFLNFKPSQPMKITCLTIGSRGDVQPYIALCKRLLEEGHHPRIATHGEFKEWVEGHGIEFRDIGGTLAPSPRAERTLPQPQVFWLVSMPCWHGGVGPQTCIGHAAQSPLPHGQDQERGPGGGGGR
ncbi:hypothetical protein B0H63DRAFT_529883 [Podospora didyma]|uniref:PH domain-containing protein n=1 Tax=Podospora didyma TaxID=330526 RepID=A0AAE0JY29_9PEZI|nr:hypothetical protein B0H63DRAFT_529883 [Podospora didyma]